MGADQIWANDRVSSFERDLKFGLHIELWSKREICNCNENYLAYWLVGLLACWLVGLQNRSRTSGFMPQFNESREYLLVCAPYNNSVRVRLQIPIVTSVLRTPVQVEVYDQCAASHRVNP